MVFKIGFGSFLICCAGLGGLIIYGALQATPFVPTLTILVSIIGLLIIMCSLCGIYGVISERD